MARDVYQLRRFLVHSAIDPEAGINKRSVGNGLESELIQLEGCGELGVMLRENVGHKRCDQSPLTWTL